jgi:hypothetical protein
MTIAVFAVAACAGDDAGDAGLEFGIQGEPCAPTVLRNEPDDEQIARAGSTCFLSEAEAGRPVVWDVLVPTVEGDPIPRRYDFDGRTFTITVDATRDEFGNSGVSVVRCEVVAAGRFLPEWSDCDDASGEGFRSDSLP